jgi:hypothetical protein
VRRAKFGGQIAPPESLPFGEGLEDGKAIQLYFHPGYQFKAGRHRPKGHLPEFL